jgi:hypothetical protein
VAEVVGGLVMTVGVPLVLWLVFRGTSDPPPLAGDALVLRYPRAVAASGWGTWAFGVGMAVWIVGTMEAPTVRDLVGAAGLALFFGALGTPLLLLRAREWVRVTPEGVEGQTAFSRRPVRLAWGEIERVRFSRLTAYLTLDGPGGRSVRVGALLQGVGVLADAVERRLWAAGAAEAVRQFREYRVGYGLS